MAKPLADKKPDHSHRSGGGPSYPLPPYGGGGYMGDPYGAYGGGGPAYNQVSQLANVAIQTFRLHVCKAPMFYCAFINTIFWTANDIW